MAETAQYQIYLSQRTPELATRVSAPIVKFSNPFTASIQLVLHRSDQHPLNLFKKKFAPNIQLCSQGSRLKAFMRNSKHM